MPEPDPVTPHAPERTRSLRRRVGVVGVLGEILLTAGALILLFLGWQLWWNDAIMAAQQSDAASGLSAEWAEEGRASRGDEPAPAAESYGDPAVDTTPYDNGDTFAVMYVPRFGEDSQRQVTEGIGLDVLNSFEAGVGHYPGTQMPGEVGNFAIAAHRSAPVPHRPDLPTDRIVTLTSCNPLYSTAERIIAYGVLESWQPALAGPPAEIAAQVEAWGA